jgi:tricorn protease-like protein
MQKEVLLTITDPEPEDTGKVKTAKPMVMDKYKIKQDVEGYRYKKLYNHLYLFDIESKKTDTLTKGQFNHSAAVWSPDGSKIAFVSNQTEDPDKNGNSDIFVIDAKPGAVAKEVDHLDRVAIITLSGARTDKVLLTRALQAPKTMPCMISPFLAVISLNGGEPKLLSQSLDRGVGSPKWLATTIRAL